MSRLQRFAAASRLSKKSFYRKQKYKSDILTGTGVPDSPHA